jgi:hypothetical protein
MANCNHCKQPLLESNHTIADGCFCNSRRGINHGLVPVHVCTCEECDPARTGGARPGEVSAKPPSLEQAIAAAERAFERM